MIWKKRRMEGKRRGDEMKIETGETKDKEERRKMRRKKLKNKSQKKVRIRRTKRIKRQYKIEKGNGREKKE